MEKSKIDRVCLYFYHQGIFSCCLSTSVILHGLLTGRSNLLMMSNVMMVFNLLCTAAVLYLDAALRLNPRRVGWGEKWPLPMKTSAMFCLNWVLAMVAVAVIHH